MKTLNFYFDYASPYSYLANTQISKVIQNTKANLVYKPVLLGGIFKATGNQAPMTNPVKSKTDYLLTDIFHWADYYQCPLVLNPFFPVNSLSLMRIACFLKDQTIFEQFHDAAFNAIWQDEKNMAEAEEINTLLSGLGLDVEETLAAAFSEQNKSLLKSETEAAVNQNMFGVPSFIVEEEMFFGNDRLPLVEHALLKK